MTTYAWVVLAVVAALVVSSAGWLWWTRNRRVRALGEDLEAERNAARSVERYATRRDTEIYRPGADRPFINIPGGGV